MTRRYKISGTKPSVSARQRASLAGNSAWQVERRPQDGRMMWEGVLQHPIAAATQRRADQRGLQPNMTLRRRDQHNLRCITGIDEATADKPPCQSKNGLK